MAIKCQLVGIKILNYDLRVLALFQNVGIQCQRRVGDPSMG